MKTPRKHHRKFPTTLLIVGLPAFAIPFIALFTFAGPGNTSQPAQPEETSLVVSGTRVEYKNVAQKVHASGKLVHKSKQELGFKIGGTVDTVKVEEGQPVRQGQILATLDLEEINAELSKAKSLYQQRQRELERLDTLYRQKVVSIHELENARTALEVAEANLDLALEQRKHAVLTAPQDGVVLARFIEAKELVRPMQTAFLISNDQQGWIIRTQVSDKDIIRITENDNARIHFDAYPDVEFPGKVTEVAAAANPTTLLFEVEVQVNPQNKRLLEGFIGHLEIEPAQKTNVAWLPIEAVVAADNKKVQLFEVQKDHRVRLREADIAWLDSGKVAIRKGIEEGTLIVSKGATFLNEGTRVQIARSTD